MEINEPQWLFSNPALRTLRIQRLPIYIASIPIASASFRIASPCKPGYPSHNPSFEWWVFTKLKLLSMAKKCEKNWPQTRERPIKTNSGKKNQRKVKPLFGAPKISSFQGASTMGSKKSCWLVTRSLIDDDVNPNGKKRMFPCGRKVMDRTNRMVAQ